MAGYDGTIKINTKLDTGGFTKGANELSAKQKRLSDQMNVQRNSIARMKAELDSLGKTKVATPEFVTIEKEIESLTTKLIAAQDRMDKFTELNPGDTSSRAFKSIEYDVKTLESRLREAERAKNELLETGKSHISGIDTKEYQDLSEKIEQSKNRLQELQLKAREADTSLQKLGNNGKKSLDKINKSGNKYGDLKTMFVRRLKGLILNLLIFNWICKGFRTLITGIGEGMQNLAKYSKQYNAQMSELKNTNTQLKNNFAAAFEPVLTVIIPILTQLSAWLVNVTNNISKFFAILGGKSSYTIAKKGTEDYAKSLDDVSKSASGANKQLASFDELEVLSSNKDNSNDTQKDIFEDVPLDSYAKSIDNIKKAFDDLKEIFANGFLNGTGGFDSLQDRLEDIRNSLKSITKNLTEIFTDSAVVDAAKTMIDKIVYAWGQIMGAMFSNGITMAQNLIGGFDKYLEENKEFLKQKIVSLFDIASDIALIVGNAFSTFAYIFETFGSENGQAITASIIGIFTNAFLAIVELVGNVTRDILDALIRPFSDNKEEIKNALDSVLGTIASILGTLKQVIDDTFSKMNEVYDAYFKPFFESVGQGLSNLMATFLELWGTYGQPFIDSVAENLQILWNEHLKTLVDNILEAVGLVMEFLMELWDNVLQPLINWLMSSLFPLVLDYMQKAYNKFHEIITHVADAINGLVDIVKGIINILIGIVNGDWQRVWDGFGEVIDGTVTAIKGILNSLITMVEGVANAVVGIINTMIRAFNSLSFDIPGWVPAIGGNHYGFNLKEISEVKFPRLATGTVVPPGMSEFLAVLGDNNKETEVVSPLSTIKEAVAQVMAEMGSNNDQSGDIIINIDGHEVFRVVREQNKEYKKATGQSAFA